MSKNNLLKKKNDELYSSNYKLSYHHNSNLDIASAKSTMSQRSYSSLLSSDSQEKFQLPHSGSSLYFHQVSRTSAEKSIDLPQEYNMNAKHATSAEISSLNEASPNHPNMLLSDFIIKNLNLEENLNKKLQACNTSSSSNLRLSFSPNTPHSTIDSSSSTRKPVDFNDEQNIRLISLKSSLKKLVKQISNVNETNNNNDDEYVKGDMTRRINGKNTLYNYGLSEMKRATDSSLKLNKQAIILKHTLINTATNDSTQPKIQAKSAAAYPFLTQQYLNNGRKQSGNSIEIKAINFNTKVPVIVNSDNYNNRYTNNIKNNEHERTATVIEPLHISKTSSNYGNNKNNPYINTNNKYYFYLNGGNVASKNSEITNANPSKQISRHGDGNISKSIEILAASTGNKIHITSDNDLNSNNNKSNTLVKSQLNRNVNASAARPYSSKPNLESSYHLLLKTYKKKSEKNANEIKDQSMFSQSSSPSLDTAATIPFNAFSSTNYHHYLDAVNNNSNNNTGSSTVSKKEKERRNLIDRINKQTSGEPTTPSSDLMTDSKIKIESTPYDETFVSHTNLRSEHLVPANKVLINKIYQAYKKQNLTSSSSLSILNTNDQNNTKNNFNDNISNTNDMVLLSNETVSNGNSNLTTAESKNNKVNLNRRNSQDEQDIRSATMPTTPLAVPVLQKQIETLKEINNNENYKQLISKNIPKSTPTIKTALITPPFLERETTTVKCIQPYEKLMDTNIRQKKSTVNDLQPTDLNLDAPKKSLEPMKKAENNSNIIINYFSSTTPCKDNGSSSNQSEKSNPAIDSTSDSNKAPLLNIDMIHSEKNTLVGQTSDGSSAKLNQNSRAISSAILKKRVSFHENVFELNVENGVTSKKYLK